MLIVQVIVQFHKMLKNLASELNVKKTHTKLFKNTLKRHAETLELENEFIDPNVTVFTQRSTKQRQLDVNALEANFQKAMNYFNVDLNDGNIWNSFEQPLSPNVIASTNNVNLELITEPFAINQPSSTYESAHSTTQFNMPHSLSTNYVYSSTPSPQQWAQSTMYSDLPPPEQNFGQFIAAVLSNIRDETVCKRAKLEIQSVAFKYCAEDADKQLMENYKL